MKYQSLNFLQMASSHAGRRHLTTVLRRRIASYRDKTTLRGCAIWPAQSKNDLLCDRSPTPYRCFLWDVLNTEIDRWRDLRSNWRNGKRQSQHKEKREHLHIAPFGSVAQTFAMSGRQTASGAKLFHGPLDRMVGPPGSSNWRFTYSAPSMALARWRVMARKFTSLWIAVGLGTKSESL